MSPKKWPKSNSMEQYKKALFIVQTLQNAGYVAYFAGGWVRDFLLGHPSDDIDIATSATPEIVQSLFPKTIPVGISFGILVVLIENHPFEVATFRKESEYTDGRHPSHIEFSDAQQDAKRRDFTINGMFYDPIQEKVFDFVHGKSDLNNKILRAIGDAKVRFHEDRLRMIRAIRLSNRLGFTIEEKTKEAILLSAHELFPSVAIERVWQEFVKMDLSPHFKEGMLSLFETGLLSTIFPSLKNLSKQEISQRLSSLDHFPAKAPLIAKILQLFPASSLEEKLSLCHFLKLSNQEIDFVFLMEEAKRLVEKNGSLQEWAHFFAKEKSSLAQEILQASLPFDQRSFAQKEERKKRERLKKAIFRIQTKDPVVGSEDLKKNGIPPGKEMGLLLKEAERIAIEEDLDTSNEVLKKLKNSSLWPKN
jgi:poly(A) polymerase